MSTVPKPLLPFENLPHLACSADTIRKGRQRLSDSSPSRTANQPDLFDDNKSLFDWSAELAELIAENNLFIALSNEDRLEHNKDLLRRSIYNTLVSFYTVPDSVFNFEDYVPRNMYRYLDRHYASWVCRIPRLTKIAYELAEQGKHRIGHVIQMTEVEITAQTSATPKQLVLIKDDLAGVGLRLGMKAPGWIGKPTRAQLMLARLNL